MSGERNAEIWSTRLQRELLALTVGGAEDKQDVAAVLPPFIAVQDHHLDIAKGSCQVSFVITIPKAGATSTTTDEPHSIVVTLDTSLYTRPDGTLDTSVSAYPFQQPTVILTSGASCFPPGSTVQDQDPIDIDCDWTPSLHLTDAVLNVGLKIKESILQGEPFHKAVTMEGDPVEDLVKGAKRFGNFLTKSARGFVATTTKPPNVEKAKKPKAKPKKKATKAADIQIGDEINLLESPWVDCHGVYSCKAIRRPGFVEDAMALAATDVEPKEVAGAGFAGAGAMFRSFTQSAKSVLEESFLMITDTHIIELRSSKLNLSSGTVTFAVSIDMMAKLKFRRQESISLFFKPAPDDPLIFMCPDSADAVHQIQAVLKARGVKGKHTSTTTQRAIHEALQLVQEIQAKERALEYQPSVERVNEIMDLYRQAAERFEVAGDVRHEEVVTHMRKFLALPRVISILDGTFQSEDTLAAGAKRDTSTVPQGEVLERTKEQLEDDDNSVGPSKEEEVNKDKEFEENMDSLLKEAKADLETLNKSKDEEDDLDDLLAGGDAIGDVDALADFDAMLSAADKELADIMNS